MRKLLCFIVLVSFGFSGHSQKSGIEIYFLQKYQNTEPKCYYCFDEKNLVFSDKPILEENDIDYFDWKKQKITLSKTGKNKISKLKIALSGIPVVMVLNNKLIYGFWFWNNFSSFGCDRVYTYPKKDFKIKFGLPSNNIFGVDPRFNPELKKYILKKFPQHYSVD